MIRQQDQPFCLVVQNNWTRIETLPVLPDTVQCPDPGASTGIWSSSIISYLLHYVSWVDPANLRLVWKDTVMFIVHRMFIHENCTNLSISSNLDFRNHSVLVQLLEFFFRLDEEHDVAHLEVLINIRSLIPPSGLSARYTWLWCFANIFRNRFTAFRESVHW
jgi:hypothetical protein